MQPGRRLRALPARSRWPVRLGIGLLAGVALAAAALPLPRLWSLPGRFVDEKGLALELASLAGVPTVVAMEYTECRFVCSLAWRKLADIQAAADRQQRPLRFVIISIDPARDTPALWREYRKARGLERANWRFLTGNRAATDAAAAALGVRWWWYEDQLMHDFRIVRLDAEGRVVRTMDTYDLSADAFVRD